MTEGHRIARFEDPQAFLDKVVGIGYEKIDCTKHALFRLSEGQRKMLNCDALKRFLIERAPLKVGVQNNGLYSAFYAFEPKRIMRIVLRMSLTNVYIATFYLITDDAFASLQKW